MKKDQLIQYYCSDDFLELYLGNFRICDRPKRMIFRFLSEENLAECETSSPVRPREVTGRPNDLFLFQIPDQQTLQDTIINRTDSTRNIYKEHHHFKDFDLTEKRSKKLIVI